MIHLGMAKSLHLGVGGWRWTRWRAAACVLQVDNALMAEYQDELLVMSQLQHENIVRFLGASMTPPHLCFVMELCDASLFAMLHEQRAAFTTYERVQVACDVAAAMHYLHTREVSGRP